MYFDKNIQAMPEKMNKLKKYLIEKKSENNKADIEFGVEEIDGRKVLFAVKEGKLYQLDTMYNQDVMLDLWYHGMDPKFNSKFLMFGFGNGMFVEKLIKETEKETTFYIYEPAVDGLIKAFHEYDLSEMLLTDRMYIFLSEVYDTENAFYDYLTEITDYTDVQGTRNCIYPNYKNIFPEAYEKYNAIVQELMDSLQANRQVLERFGESYYRNPFINYPYLTFGKSIDNLWAFFDKDIPVIIVSSGPSLSKNVEEIKRAKGKAFIIAADSAVSVLLNHDIIPDMFVCVDSKKNPGHFTNPLIKNIPMLCMLHTSIYALKEHNAPCFFINDTNPHVGAFTNNNHVTLPMLSSGGSVANNAMSFAEMMGIKTFILVGQDLAYTGNKTHAEGSLRATWNVDIDYSKCYVEGYDGEQILSSNEFRLYRDWIEREIIDRKDIKVINATEGGAKIHGAIQTTLKEAIDEYCKEDVDVSRIFEKARYIFDIKERELFKEYMVDTPVQLKDLEQRVKKGISIYEKMEELIYENKYQSQRFLTYYRQSEEITKSLQDTPAIYYPECIMQKEVGEYLKEAYDLEDSERKELLTAIGQGKDYLNLLKSKIEIVIPEIENYNAEAKKLYAERSQGYNNLREFANDSSQLVYEQIKKFITPELELADLYNLISLISNLPELAGEDYDVMTQKIFELTKSLRKETVLLKLAIYSCFVEKIPEVRDEIKKVCMTHDMLKGRHLYYLWYYLKEIGCDGADDVYKLMVEKYKAELAGDISLLKMSQDDSKPHISLGVFSSDKDLNEQKEIAEKCISKAGDNVIPVFICTYERGAENGIIPLFGHKDKPDDHPDDYTIDVGGKEYSCVIPSTFMPDERGYKELFDYLSDYYVENVVASEDSLFGLIISE